MRMGQLPGQPLIQRGTLHCMPRSLALLPTTLVVLLVAPSARAECAAIDEFAEATAIFQGRVVEVTSVCPPEPDESALGRIPYPWSECHSVVRFEVLRAWKGVSKSEYRLVAHEGQADGDITFRVGEQWLVFAFPPPYEQVPEGLVLPHGSPAAVAHSCSLSTGRLDDKDPGVRSALRRLQRLPTTYVAPKKQPRR